MSDPLDIKLAPLPITRVLPQVQKALSRNPILVLTAKPGAGKTTYVPLALQKEPWLQGKKIIMLEPRRLAARAAARRMATLAGEPVGKSIGYRTRLDSKIGADTKIEVVTEGILTRLLHQDPSLNEYGLVIFDEFHERSLQADLGLAFTLQSRSFFREDLRLLVMSATLDSRSLNGPLKQAPLLTCEGRIFPVETRYLGPLDPRDSARKLAQIIHRTLLSEEGNLLVFLPGAGEIRRVAEQLTALSLPPNTFVAPLYGDLSPAAQDQAIFPPAHGQRKVVLATNIAETSLTIEGIRIVVDSGFMRVPRFDPRCGMSRLTTVPISQASAEQRRGRAGRLEPGLCIRCWAEPTQRTLALRTPPEILEADLAPLALDLALWGTHDVSALSWLDLPPPGALAQARKLLCQLGALDHNERITQHGRRMADLPTHPRLAHMILQGQALGLGLLACDLAAVLSERDLLKRNSGQREADLRIRIEELDRKSRHSIPSDIVQRIRRTSQMWQRDLNPAPSPMPRKAQIEEVGMLLGWAFPDRIAQRQTDGLSRYKMANGRMAQFFQHDPLGQEEFVVIAELDGGQPVSHIYLAAPIDRKTLLTRFQSLIHPYENIGWDQTTESVAAFQQHRLGEVVLENRRVPPPDSETVRTALLEAIRKKGLSCLPWTKDQRLWRARVQFLCRVMGPDSQWPDVTDDTLIDRLEDWLAPYLMEIASFAHLQKLDLTWPLQALLSPDQRGSLDILAPTHLTVPTGSRIALDYHSGETPILAVRLQELFGLTETPRLGNGKIPVIIHLLSPARRPVQVTQDLKSFWQTGYPEVKKELRGRYPKHFWPDDPLRAPPTRGLKKP